MPGLLRLMCACLYFIFPTASFASADKLTDILNNAVSYAQSGPARGFCLLAIIGAGYLWLAKGMIPKHLAVGIVGGSGLIFGASYIGQFILGVS